MSAVFAPARRSLAVELSAAGLRGERLADATNALLHYVVAYTITESVVARTPAQVGGVHLVCNNAGIGSGSEGHVWEHHVNDWRWSLDVNVMGVVNGINAFVPHMVASGEEGHVVNTTSGNGGFTPLINSADLRDHQGRRHHDHRMPLGSVEGGRLARSGRRCSTRPLGRPGC